MSTIRWLWYLPAGLWAMFLLYLGSRTFDLGPEAYTFPWDKVAHIGLYGVLGCLAVLGWRRAGRRPHIVLPLLLALAVGVTDEVRQRSVVGRSADPYDFLADLVAIALAFAILGRAARTEEAE